MSSSLHPVQQSCSEHNFQLSCSSSTQLSSCEYYWEDWKRLFGQRNKDSFQQCPRHLLHLRYVCTGCEAPLSFVWKRGFTLAPFMAMLQGCWVRPINSTHEQICRPFPPQGVCPELNQPASCWPSQCHSSTPLLAPDLSYLTVIKSLQLAFCLLSIIFARTAQAALPLIWKARFLKKTHLFLLTRRITE